MTRKIYGRGRLVELNTREVSTNEERAARFKVISTTNPKLGERVDPTDHGSGTWGVISISASRIIGLAESGFDEQTFLLGLSIDEEPNETAAIIEAREDTVAARMEDGGEISLEHLDHITTHVLEIASGRLPEVLQVVEVTA